jgi:hypothetical protein
VKEHLDAEIVAGWADGTLDPHVRAAAESHAADCARCQAVLAAMVRTEAAVTAPAGGWLAARVRWLVPLATAAAAAALWFGLSGDVLAPGTGPLVTSRTEPAPEAMPERGPTAAAPLAGPTEAAKREIAPEESRRRLESPGQPPPRSAARQEKSAGAADNAALDRVSPPSKPEPSAAPEVARVEEQRRDALAGRGVPPPAAAAPAAPATVTGERVLVQTQSQQAQTQTQTQVGETQLARQAAFSANLATFRDVASADPAVRYRVGPNGHIERSADGGRSWTVQRSGVTHDLLAAAAPSADVCWVVGRSGVVLLTIDGGATWKRVPFPEPIDLRSVEAIDARTATITARDDRMFRTVDGGATWQR